MAGSSSFFRGPEGGTGVRRRHAEVIAVDAATAATHRWTSGARGRGVGSVWGNGRRGRPCLSGGPSAGGAFVAHTPKSSLSTPPPPPLIGGRTVRAVEGSDQWRGADGMWRSSSFSGVGVGARETSGVSTWVSDWGAAREGDQLAHPSRVPHVCTLGTRRGYCAGYPDPC